MGTSVNNKCKSFTSLEQSRKLAEILPLESADMCYRYYSGGMITGYGDCVLAKSFITGKDVIRENDLPCWSLAALLSALPLVSFTTPQLIGTPKTLYRCMYNDDLKSHAYDNPIDACYELILKLHELDLL